MKNKTLKSKISKNIKIIKTLQEKPSRVLKEIESIEKEQKKYRDFLTKQSRGKYAYIETQSFATV